MFAQAWLQATQVSAFGQELRVASIAMEQEFVLRPEVSRLRVASQLGLAPSGPAPLVPAMVSISRTKEDPRAGLVAPPGAFSILGRVRIRAG